MSGSKCLIENIYTKKPKNMTQDIEELRKWLYSQPHLPHNTITDSDLILAHHRGDHNIELTKKLIDLNYTLRTLFSFYAKRLVDTSLRTACHTWLVTPLTTLTLKGYRVIYCHLLDPDPANFVYKDVVRAFTMMIDLLQHEEGTWPGVAIVVNMDRVTLAHVSAIDLAVAQQFFYFIQEAMFVRLKEFHFINCPVFVDQMLSILKPFMKKEMLEMLMVHRVGSDTLDLYLPRNALPKEAGGGNKDCISLRDEVWDRISKNTEFFDEESKKRVDESKRLGGVVTLRNIFPSIEESFKNLSID